MERKGNVESQSRTSLLRGLSRYTLRQRYTATVFTERKVVGTDTVFTETVTETVGIRKRQRSAGNQV